MKRSDRIVMVFVSMGDYRLNTMKILKHHFSDALHIFAGEKAPNKEIRTIAKSDLDYRSVTNLYLPFGIVIQLVDPRAILMADLVVADLNPRLPLVWLTLVVRRLLRKPTVLWGHAFPRGGRAVRTEALRSAMRKLANGIIAYTHAQARELARMHPKQRVSAAPNAIYRHDQFVFDESSVRNHFIYVGRLVDTKKPSLLLTAFEEAAQRQPDIHLTVIGDGPLLEEIRQRARDTPSFDRIHILGHNSDYAALRDAYSRAIASVSPGYVGLSVTQSLSFGVPMIISRDEPHAPEIEAVKEGENCVFFETDSHEDLAAKMVMCASQRGWWQSRGKAIMEQCRASYSAESMAAGLVASIEMFQ